MNGVSSLKWQGDNIFIAPRELLQLGRVGSGGRVEVAIQALLVCPMRHTLI